MRKLRRRYKKPKRPWDSSRIEEEKKILREFGLKRKREIWIAEAIVREFRRRARDLIAIKDEDETKILLDKLVGLGLLQRGQGLENVLALNVTDILNRRLQTLVLKKGFADTIRHARQKITHGNIYMGNRKMIFPSYIVPVENEKLIKLKGGKKV
ncbi:MAG: 30S ribosomal protein S4 [Candidatus Aenigmarchaeota archaeon]|nr:30S ribosomal protein S4 [Candidatus Aenigmarchaeota archaeon]